MCPLAIHLQVVMHKKIDHGILLPNICCLTNTIQDDADGDYASVKQLVLLKHIQNFLKMSQFRTDLSTQGFELNVQNF